MLSNVSSQDVSRHLRRQQLGEWIVRLAVVALLVVPVCDTGCRRTAQPISTDNARPEAVSPRTSAAVVAGGSTATDHTENVGDAPSSAADDSLASAARNSTDVRQLVGVEELILRLTPQLKRLAQDVRNLCLPAEAARPLLHPEAEFWDLQSPVAARDEASQTGLSLRVAEQPTALPRVTNSWQALFAKLDFFEHASFSFVRGEFTSSAWDEFRTDVAFSGLAHRTQGSWIDVHIQLELLWHRDGASDAATWHIVSFRPRTVRLVEAHQLLFADQLDQRIPNSHLREKLRESDHYRYAVRHYYRKLSARLPVEMSDARFFPISTAYHPGIAVVDIDGDGWDDLYLTVRWGNNLLLRNRGDGTFEEVAHAYGLDLPGRSNAAIFADFDNDGDPDLMLARSLERSRYLVNEDGHFVDRSDWVDFPLPFEATSASVADYNRDGLLDVYFCTYHQDDISRRLDADLANPDHRIHRTLTAEHSAELKRRFRNDTRSFVSQVGPPNILLANVGAGRFQLADHNPQVAGWRNAFQASWADYDQDGDADLYVANDFAADQLFRNDGSQGFHEVTGQIGIDRLGFAMGASWADADNDGLLDLYVSNMFSKAGQRITSQIDGLDARIPQLADGNYLYRYDGQRFHLTSGFDPPQWTVAQAGWSWGGQFVDVNNDGFEDLYVPNGYYTVPAEFETNVDL